MEQQITLKSFYSRLVPAGVTSTFLKVWDDLKSKHPVGVATVRVLRRFLIVHLTNR